MQFAKFFPNQINSVVSNMLFYIKYNKLQEKKMSLPKKQTIFKKINKKSIQFLNLIL